MRRRVIRSLVSTACLAAIMTTGLAAQAATPIEISGFEPYDRIYVQGVPAAFPSEDGKTLFPAFMYNGTTYIHLRTAGKWMGKNVAWDGATRTVTLSGYAAQEFPSSEDAQYHGTGMVEVPAEDTAEISPEVSVVIDGVKQSFRNQKGETIYPVFFRNSVYLPLRNIGELTGFEVTWYGAQNESEGNGIFLRTPITDTQETEMRSFITAVAEIGGDLEDTLSEMQDACFTWVTKSGTNSYGEPKADLTLTNTQTAISLLPEVKRLAEQIESAALPSGDLLDYYGNVVQERAAYIVDTADDLIRRLTAGEQPILSSNYSADNRDDGVAQIMATGNNILTDCEIMTHILDQNMKSVYTS